MVLMVILVCAGTTPRRLAEVLRLYTGLQLVSLTGAVKPSGHPSASQASDAVEGQMYLQHNLRYHWLCANSGWFAVV